MTTQQQLPMFKVLPGRSRRHRVEQAEGIHEITGLVFDLFDGRSVVLSDSAWYAAVRLGGAAKRMGMTEASRSRALGYQAWCAKRRGDSTFISELITDYAWTVPTEFRITDDADGITIEKIGE